MEERDARRVSESRGKYQVGSLPSAASPYVDYDQIARRYRARRALPDDVLDTWCSVVRRYVPGGQILVADVGAGTGIFTAAWSFWAPAAVIAIEPSAAMVAEAGTHDAYVHGIAEALPLAASTVDVVWVSTALHHFPDASRAVAEFRRVLKDGGRVLVRTHLPERAAFDWFELFPGHSRALKRLPRLDALQTLFSENRFSLLGVEDVLEHESSFAASADWAESMRSADSMMTALTDEEVAEGLRRLRAEPDRVARVELSLVVFKKDS